MSVSAKHEGMSSADAAWLHMDRPVNPMVINALVQLEGRLSQPRLEEVLGDRLIAAHPKFAMRVSEHVMPLQGPSWEGAQRFEIARHIHRLSPREPRDETALRELVADIVSTPLPHDRPLWQMHLIDVQGGTALLVRMHHCIADGIALARVLLSLTDGAPDRAPIGASGLAPSGASGQAPSGASGQAPNGTPAASAPARQQLADDAAPSHPHVAAVARAAEAIAHQGMESALHPKRLVSLAESGVRDAQTLAKLLLQPADPTGGLKGELSGGRRVGWCEPLSLTLVKEIAHKHHATVNDVMLSAVAGAFRAHMLRTRTGANRAGPAGRARVRAAQAARPTPGKMHAIVPFNLRPLQEPLPRGLGNRFGLVFLDLPVDVGDRRKRLAVVKERMDAIKASPEGPVSYGVLQVIGLAPERVESTFVDLFSSKGTAVVTNVPGPQSPRWLAGSRVQSLQVWAPTSGSVGISVSVISYDGAITVGLMADASRVRDPQRVADRVGVEMDALARLRAPRAVAA